MKTKNKTLGLILGIFLFVSLFSMVSAIPYPDEPEVEKRPRVSVFPLLSITGQEAVAVGEPSNHDWDLRAKDDEGNNIYPDRDMSDLKYSWFFGIFSIMDSSGNVVYEEGPKDLGTLNKYTGKAQYSFEESGTYYYAPAIVEVKQEYKDGQWEKVSEEVIEKEVMEVNVAGEPDKPVLSKIGDFFNSLWDWIKGIF